MLTLLGGTLLGSLWLIAAYLCLLIWQRRKTYRRRQRPRPIIDERLMILLNGDWKTAERLITYTRRRQPERPLGWCIEKTIHDLERDRR